MDSAHSLFAYKLFEKESLTMSKKAKFEELANSIIGLVGEKENIVLFTHCVTRLRFNVKDKSRVKVKEIEAIKGVIGYQWAGDQLQVIVGQEVDDAYQLICQKAGLMQQNAINEDLDQFNIKKEKKKLTISSAFSTIADIISGSLIPFIPVIVGAGMLKVLCLLLSTFGIMDPNSSTYIVLSIVGDASFYFLPVFVAKGAAKKFGADEGLGMLIGLMLVAPAFVGMIDEGIALSFLGIPVYATSYGYLVFPSILCVAVMTPVQKFFRKISPEMFRIIIEPFGTLMVMIPLTFCLLAPLGAIVGAYLTEGILWLYNTTGFVGMAILGVIYPLLVITGMHNATTPFVIESFAKMGFDPLIMPIDCLNNINQGIASVAVGFKTKNKELKSTGFTCGMTAIVGGISEPSLYSINLKFKTPLICACIGNSIGAGICGFMKVYCYTIAGTGGIFAIPCFMGPVASNLLFYIIAMIVGGLVTFVTTYMFYKDEVAY